MSIYTNDLQTLYVAYFNRPADPAGLAFWEAALASGRANLNTVRAAFAQDKEYKAAFAGKTNTQIVTQVYLNLFGDQPDVQGLQFWVQKMAEGAVTIDTVVAEIAKGAQNEDRVAIQSKTAAAVAFTESLNTIDEINAYETAAGQTVAKNFISGVIDAATLQAATTTANLNKITGDVVIAGNPGAAAVAAAKASYDTAAATAAAALTDATAKAAAATTAAAAVTAAETAATAAQTKADATDAVALATAAATAKTASDAAAAAKVTADANVVTAQAAFNAAVTAGDPTAVTIANGNLLIAQARAATAATAATDAAAKLATAQAAATAAAADDTAAANAAAAVNTAVTAATGAAAAAVAAGTTATTAATAAANAAAAYATAANGTAENADNAAAAAAVAAAATASTNAAKAAADATAANAVVQAVLTEAQGRIEVSAALSAYNAAVAAAATAAAATAAAATAADAAIAGADSLEKANAAIAAATAQTNAAAAQKTAADAVAAAAAAYVAAAAKTSTGADNTAAQAAVTAANAALASANAATAAAAADATQAAALPGNFVAKTFSLTKGLDIVQGGAGADRIIASIDTGNAEVNTLNSVDSIDGGAGVDTLVIAAGTALTTAALGDIKNVEILEVRAAANINVNTSGLTGLTNVNIVRAEGAVDLTSAATTNIDLNLKASTNATSLKGGLNVTANLTDVTGTTGAITIGAPGQGAAGAVVVNTTGAASVAGNDVTLTGVTTTGGTTVNVTQKATSSAAAAVADLAGATVTQGAVTVNGTAVTTAVTVKQDVAQAEFTAVTGVTAKSTTEEVIFTAAKAGDVIKVDFGTGELWFTAKKDLTAAQVASAFANLTRGATQGSASAELGIYTDAAGGVTDRWTSGAVETVSATTARVVFTSTTAAADLSASVVNFGGSTTTATAQNRSGGTTGVTAESGQLGIVNGAVTVNDAAGSIKTVTLDAYGAGSSITGGALLETLNLSNTGVTYVANDGSVSSVAGLTVADTAATLALNLNKVGVPGVARAGITLTAAPTTLNVTSTGANHINLVANATETLNVTGTGALNAAGSDLTSLKTVKVSGSAGLTLNAAVDNTVESVDTTGTTGTVTISIQGDKATYAGGAGSDRVTITNADTAISKSINLGAGNDILTLTGAGVAVDPASTVELIGGDGTDTLVLSAATAVARSGGVSFQDRFSGFEKLSVGQTTGTSTINLDNLDDINYVISGGAVAGPAPTALGVATSQGANTVPATPEKASVTFTGLNDGESFTVAGRTLTATGGNLTAAQVAAAFATNTGSATAVFTGVLTNYTPAAGAGVNEVVFTSTIAGDVANLVPTAGGGAVAPGATITASTPGSAATFETATITFSALAAGQTYTVGGYTVTAGAGGLSANAVASIFAANTDLALFTVTGSTATTVTYTAKTAGNVTDIVTSAAAAPGAGGNLVLDKMLNNATVEFAAAGNVEVKLADASGSADVVNFVTAAASGTNIGTATADKVETININVTNTGTATNVSNNILTVDADAAKTINVGGAGNLTLTLSSDTDAVTLIDGSSATGILSITTSDNDTAGTTVRGGSGADVLTAMGANDVLLGGAGNDTLRVMGGVASAVTLSGGEGVDLFDVSGFRAANAGAAASITDLVKGEKIKFVSSANADFVSSKVSLISEATFDNYVTEATKAADAATADHGIAWFQFQGNTFIVQDVNGDGAFTDGTDIIVKLTGIVDLSNSSFNEVGQGTLQYL